jgi:hypothetical protein
VKLTRKAVAGICGAAAIVIAGGVTGGILAASGSSQFTSHGSIEVDTTPGEPDPCTDSQAVIVAPDGSVIGSAQLQDAGPVTPALSGFQEISTGYTWKVTLPAESRYGIQACGASHGTTWETPAQMKSGSALDLDLTGG